VLPRLHGRKRKGVVKRERGMEGEGSRNITLTFNFVLKEKARNKLQIIQTAKVVGLTMAYRNKGPQRSLAWVPPRA